MASLQNALRESNLPWLVRALSSCFRVFKSTQKATSLFLGLSAQCFLTACPFLALFLTGAFAGFLGAAFLAGAAFLGAGFLPPCFPAFASFAATAADFLDDLPDSLPVDLGFETEGFTVVALVMVIFFLSSFKNKHPMRLFAFL